MWPAVIWILYLSRTWLWMASGLASRPSAAKARFTASHLVIPLAGPSAAWVPGCPAAATLLPAAPDALFVALDPFFFAAMTTSRVRIGRPRRYSYSKLSECPAAANHRRTGREGDGPYNPAGS